MGQEMMRIIPIRMIQGFLIYMSQTSGCKISFLTLKEGLFEIEQTRDYPWWWSVMRLPLIDRLSKTGKQIEE